MDDDSDSVNGTISTSSSSGVHNNELTKNLNVAVKAVPDIDFIGNGGFQVSQLNLLQKRSVEPFRDSIAKLSARGLYHRSGEHFTKEAQSTSMIILGEIRNGKRLGGKSNKPSAYLFTPYFQRALAYERLNEIDKAIADYSACLSIENKFAPAYFNRGGLYRVKGMLDKALADLERAVQLDPANSTYRSNRALLFRQKGQFLEATQDTMICRAMTVQPSIIPDIASGAEVALDSEALCGIEIEEDPVIKILSKPIEQRTVEEMGPVVDFLTTIKFFGAFATNRDLLSKIAVKLLLQNFSKGEYIFVEGQAGYHYHMILDGEVSIVKIKINANGDITDTITLVKLFRGQAFGETALEGKGIRTAGAMATQPTNLIGLHVNDYQDIMKQYKKILRAEVRDVLCSIPVFADWEAEKIDHLASFAVLRSYSPNFEILREGDPMKHLYIVKKGIVKLIKSMERPQVANLTLSDLSHPEAAKKVEAPGLWVLDKNWRDRLEMFDEDGAKKGNKNNNNNGNNSVTNNLIDFTVGVLGSGQVFGELAVLDPSKTSPVSAISFTAVELYCIEGDVLIALGLRFNATSMNALNESLNLHNPPAEKISYYFRSKFAWESRKARLLQNITGMNSVSASALPPIANNASMSGTSATNSGISGGQQSSSSNNNNNNNNSSGIKAKRK